MPTLATWQSRRAMTRKKSCGSLLMRPADAVGAWLAEAVAKFAEQYPDVPVQRVACSGPGLDALATESATADLIVVGSHGETVLRARLMSR